MKFPRNAKVFRGQLDVAAFAGVFFALCLMLVFSTLLVHSLGWKFNCPRCWTHGFREWSRRLSTLPWMLKERFTLKARSSKEPSFKNRLSHVVAQFEKPPTLIIQGDANADLSMVLNLCELASKTGVSRTLWATRMLEPAIQTVP